MSAPVTVTHPVPCRHRPPRARSDRFAHLTGRTPVEVKPFDAAPREIARYRDTPIVEAEGRAWMQARDAGSTQFLDTERLRTVLEGIGERTAPGAGEFATLLDYLVRSPLCRFDGRSVSRSGGIAPDRAGAFAEGAIEKAAESVRAFVHDRIRLHGDAVYLRYERLLFASPLHVGFATEFPIFPRMSDGASAHLGTRGYQGMEMSGGGWEEHRAIPAQLLENDDALWFANVLPQRMLATLSRPGLRLHLDDGARREAGLGAGQEVEALRDAIKPLAHLGQTLSITGDDLRPAIQRLHGALDHLVRLSSKAANRTRMLVYADDARAYRHAAETIRRDVLPRLEAQLVPPASDVEALSHLAP